MGILLQDKAAKLSKSRGNNGLAQRFGTTIPKKMWVVQMMATVGLYLRP
jgi:hypothetical protein